MKTIYFNNGRTLSINQGDLDTLRESVLKGYGNFQFFSNEDDETVWKLVI